MIHRQCFSSRIGKLLLPILLTLIGVTAAAEPRVEIEGAVQYSFRPGHYVVQTDRGTLHVRGDLLDLPMRTQFERAMTSAGEIRIEVPVRSVEYYSADTEKVAVERDSRTVEGLWFLDPIRARIEGTKQHSWEESFYLIQAGPKVYKVSLNQLSVAQARSIQAIGPGGHVSAELPIRSVELAWTLPLPDVELPVVTQMADEIEVEMDQVKITGTILWSWSESKSNILARNHIIRFDRTAVDAAVARELDHLGSRTSLKVPLAAIEAMWSIDPASPTPVRGPAGLVP